MKRLAAYNQTYILVSLFLAVVNLFAMPGTVEDGMSFGDMDAFFRVCRKPSFV